MVNSFNRPEYIFKTNPDKLSSILIAINEGRLGLPYFQRDWVWEPENIKELLISVVQAFPVGSLLTLRHNKDIFKVKHFSGTDIPEEKRPERLVLDGQQRLTSLYQTLYSKEGVKKEKQKDSYFFYLSLQRLIEHFPIEEAIFYVHSNKVYKEDRHIVYELKSDEDEFENLCLPFNIIMHDSYHTWLRNLKRYYLKNKNYDYEKVEQLDENIEKLHKQYIDTIKNYEFPVVELHEKTPLTAVCHIFEKVNTAGMVLNVFELLTAILWAQGTDLPKLWREAEKELKSLPNVEGVNIDRITFLQTVSLLATLSKKNSYPDQNFAVSCRREALLELNSQDIELFWQQALTGYKKSAKILYENGIYSSKLLPYKALVYPLAAICAQIFMDLGDIKQSHIYNKIKVWFWRSVFSSRYSSASESKAAKDFEQMMDWIDKDIEPDIVRQFSFNPQILREITTIHNAIYSGILCLILKYKPSDFRSGFEISTQLFHDEKLDHHHVFPKKYLEKAQIESRQINCILNKTLIDAYTNRSIRDKSPSVYVKEMENKDKQKDMNKILASHLLNKDIMLSAPQSIEYPQDQENLKQVYKKFLDERFEKIVMLINEATNVNKNGEGI